MISVDALDYPALVDERAAAGGDCRRHVAGGDSSVGDSRVGEKIVVFWLDLSASMSPTIWCFPFVGKFAGYDHKRFC